MSADKGEKELDDLAKRYGFTREGKITKNHRIKYVHRNGEVVFASPTSTDYRAIKNLEGEFKRRSGQ